MSIRKSLLASRLSSMAIGVEDHDASAVGEAVDKVADAIIEAAADKAAESVAEATGAAAPEAEAAAEAEGEAAEAVEGEAAEAVEGEAAEGEATEAAESEEGEADAEGEEGEAEEPKLDSAAEEILEVNEAGNEVAEEEDAAEDVAEVAEGLESIAMHMESTIANGGLTPQAALGFQLATEAYMSRVGLENTAIPSMESFGGSGTRVQYTQVSVENIREKVDQLWKAFLEMLNKARELASRFFQRLFTATGQIKAKAASIMKSADGLGAKSTEDVSGGPSAKLTIGGKVPSDISAALNDLFGLVTASYEYSGKAVDFAKAVSDGLSSSIDAGNDEKFTQSVAEMIKKVSSATPAFEPADKEYRGNETGGVGMEGKQTETHLGEVKVIAIRLSDANVDQATSIRGLAGQRNNVEIGSGEAVEKLPTLSGDQIKAIAKAVVDFADAVDGYKEVAGRIDKQLADVAKVGKGFQKLATKAESLSGENKKLVSPLMSVVKSVPAMVSQPSQKLTQHAMSVAQAAMKYCADSVKAYDKAESKAVVKAEEAPAT